MIQSKPSIRWKKDRIFSLRLRNGHYVLMQMIVRPGFFAVFKIFREHDSWSDVKLTKSDVLFTFCLLRNALGRCEVVTHNDVQPVSDLEYDETRVNISGGFRNETLWAGTENERTFLMMGNGENNLCSYVHSNGKIEEKVTPISLDEYEKYKNVELANLCNYPSLNERLYLCEILGWNIDPLRELAFNRPLDQVCGVYIDIISGKVPLKQLGY